MKHWIRAKKSFVFAGVLSLVVLLTTVGFARRSVSTPPTTFKPQDDILAIARSFPDGGGYAPLDTTGVSEEIRFNGRKILSKGKGGTYCSGFTLMVMMKAAEKRGLLRAKTFQDIRLLQKNWYGAERTGAEPSSAEKQVVVAMTSLSIGRAIEPADAKPGDFINYYRTNNSGHIAVFLDYIREGGVIVGFKFRSSQVTTNGIGDQEEYFTTSGYATGLVDPKRFYVARLN
jgi:hypothetical protein